MASNRQVTAVAVTAETPIITADTANFLDVYGLIIGNYSAVDLDAIIKDSVGGTVVWRVPIKAGTTYIFSRDIKQAERQTNKNQSWTITLSSANTVLVTAHFVQRA